MFLRAFLAGLSFDGREGPACLLTDGKGEAEEMTSRERWWKNTAEKHQLADAGGEACQPRLACGF